MAWYHIPGKEQDVVVSTRVRLARNVAGFPFPARLDAPRAREIIARVGGILEKNGFTKLDFGDISRTAAYALVEKQYVSPGFVRESLPHAVFLNEPCNLAVMVCEEDHIRLQAILPGLDLGEAAGGAFKVEALLDEALELSFDDRLGYLTRSPADLGTGMRASVMLCLPMLGATGRMEALAESMGQMGLNLHALGGEESERAHLYALSNRATLGVSEEEILAALEAGVRRIVENERRLRTMATGAELDRLTDRARRAEATLRAAELLSAEELVALLSDVRLGAAMGLNRDVRVEALTAMLIEAMPAGLTLSAEEEPKGDHERDRLRARMVREALGERMGAMPIISA